VVSAWLFSDFFSLCNGLSPSTVLDPFFSGLVILFPFSWRFSFSYFLSPPSYWPYFLSFLYFYGLIPGAGTCVPLVCFPFFFFFVLSFSALPILCSSNLGLFVFFSTSDCSVPAARRMAGEFCCRQQPSRASVSYLVPGLCASRHLPFCLYLCTFFLLGIISP